MSRLDDAIERLYAAFASVPKPRKIEGCPCCSDERELAKLLERDLRNLSSKDLSSYSFSALTTVGDVSDYLYFLPRILHLTATDDHWFTNVEITAKAIVRTDVQAWPSDRKEALDVFLGEVIQSLLAPERNHSIDEWMCAIAWIVPSVRPFLSRIEKSESAVLTYFTDNVSTLPKRRLTNAFWEPSSTAHKTIVDWFYSPMVQDIVHREYGYVLKAPDA